MTDPIMTWRAFLASPAAPRTAKSALALDGYLTGLVVAPVPAPVMPSQWIAGLWGTDEPIFDHADQVQAVLGAVMEHYNSLIAAIDRGLKRLEADRIVDYRPMFFSTGDKPAHDHVRDWVGGFWQAMALVPEAWSGLAGDERTQVLVAPFVGFIDIPDAEPFEPRDDVDDLLDEHAAAIPRAILVLRKLALIRQERPKPAPAARKAKLGRNDPCPCRSGRKYKRCCGTN